MTHEVELRPTEGHIIAGTNIDDHRFLGKVQAAQLFQIAPDPRDTEDKKKLAVNKEMQDLRSLRNEVQRLFEKAKKKNVPDYAKYIVDLHNGEDGITPVITLYSEQKLQIQEKVDGTAYIQIPWDLKLVAIDGETQLAARYEASSMEPETKKESIPVYICHGKRKIWARQSFHDLNVLGVKPSAALSIGMDARDPITLVTRNVEKKVPFFYGKVNVSSRQLSKDSAHVITLSGLRTACVTLAKGINGVQYGARPVSLDGMNVENIEKAAIDWFMAVSEALRPSLEDRENKIAAAPSVFAAIGAIGNQVVGIADDDERKARCKELAESLQKIRWERGEHWTGIAGKYTPKGNFSVGGAKEVSYAVYSALTDPSSEGYKRIRMN